MVTPEVTYAQNMYSTVYWRKAKEINAPDHGKNKKLEMIEREYVRMHQVLCFPVLFLTFIRTDCRTDL